MREGEYLLTWSHSARSYPNAGGTCLHSLQFLHDGENQEACHATDPEYFPPRNIALPDCEPDHVPTQTQPRTMTASQGNRGYLMIMVGLP